MDFFVSFISGYLSVIVSSFLQSLVEEDMVESNENVIILKTQTESPVLLAPTYVTSGSNDGELMTSFSGKLLGVVTLGPLFFF